ncbi:NAD(P)/FAD-dependent oxidoreductase [Allokutzneria sp. A3M-2-11 16]|uniref:flavin-containing monooxygenase n=1 Tax=Allokutzneria sp. A3M-2-11 16 TaxID=2962043 RepID=UPI0020B79B68|nr:NAD(P)-binding domain-containing protein [Allokutzneria sp. A3M-2-11 16]MCP3803171.1 NAD(P)/FAD-dependent oxidoreductase [Allokutzneria sp. A3M-2-11 16]
MTDIDALVIGGGQAGLATAHALRRAGREPVVLEAKSEAVGSWPSYYDSLTLFSPARYSGLPGLAFPGDPARYPRRDEVVDYLRRYAKHLAVDIRTGHRVEAVHRDGTGFRVRLADGTELGTRVLVAATGSFGRPNRPNLRSFTGTLLHSADYREPTPFTGQRVVVVGAGNTAVQVGVELAAHARVTLATRSPVRFVPQRPLGRDVHFWSTVTGIDTVPIGHLLRNPPHQPVLDHGRYRAALTSGAPDQRRMFTAVDGTRVTWPDGTRERVDTIILATGYKPDLSYLTTLGALDAQGRPLQRRGLSTTHPGLGYVGLEWQRSLSSATLRGVARDARYAVPRLLAH